ncbi:ABC-three component system middle component 1 [Rhizobium hidalgonense]|uniref:ABC-three component system middle component 1 n=1 Tax=Rhizobium hidalgonense TaxID=1538159 RepID=UPI0011070499|nr:ABC-three component system middle component 1 [Rhizobium hidalgonense]QKK27036.1 hypothetical protein FFM81_027690 [Rhizobium hidalgonense]
MADTPRFMPLLLEAADRIGATREAANTELTGSKFNSEVLSEAVSRSAIVRSNDDLPSIVGSVRLDAVPVLVGEINGPPQRSSVEHALRKYRNQATIARSWLGNAAPNLQLFLIAPIGSFGSLEWRQLAAEIESDDRVCRKLVWLCDQTPSVEDAAIFLDRTFVARPWPADTSRAALDSMTASALPEGWEEAIDDPELDFDGLVTRLVDLQAGETQ